MIKKCRKEIVVNKKGKSWVLQFIPKCPDRTNLSSPLQSRLLPLSILSPPLCMGLLPAAYPTWPTLLISICHICMYVKIIDC